MEIQSVTGPIPTDEVALADGHGHVWIEPVEGVADEHRLVLNRFEQIVDELSAFKRARGSLIVDCQPPGCGRNLKILQRISQESGVYITATTGFHQQKYYPADHWLWSCNELEAYEYFLEDLTTGRDEIKATTIKIGYEGHIAGHVQTLMQAVARASRETGSLILFHTERGANVELLVPFFAELDVTADRLYLCHVDKRPDFALHEELAQSGVLLGYDTFLRDKYVPRENVWPLLDKMVEHGLSSHVAICLDLALEEMWRFNGNPYGQLAIPELIAPQMHKRGYPQDAIDNLLGKNIVHYLADAQNERK